MSTQEEHVSPEEKLLKIIQATGKAESQAGQASGPPKAAATPVPKLAVVQPAEERIPPTQKPKLKTVAPEAQAQKQKPEARVAPAAAPAVAARPERPGKKPAPPAEAAEPLRAPRSGGSRLIGVGGPAVIHKTPARVSVGVGAVSRFLAGAAVLVTLLAGWVVWASAKGAQVHEEVINIEDLTAGGAEAAGSAGGSPPAGGAQKDEPIPGQAPLDDVVKLFTLRPILGPPPGDRVQVTTTNAGERASAPVEWEAYVKANLKLKGLSRLPAGGTEAIVSDSKTGKLLYLKAGQDLVLDRLTLKIQAVGADGVLLTDGVRKALFK